MKKFLFAGLYLFLSAVISPFSAPCQEPDSSHSRRVYGSFRSGENPGEFKPMTQTERNHFFLSKMSSPAWVAKTAASAGFRQWSDEPEEWEQGASGYGKRYADAAGQYGIRQTVTFGLESLLHEDNRYFASGKDGFGPRMSYALSSGILARHDNGKRYLSISLIAGSAGGAGLSRIWQPSGSRSFGSAASRFGRTLGWNAAFGVFREFLPDLLRPFIKKNRP